MDSKKLKIAQSKTPASLLHERLVRTGSVPKYELVYDWTTKTTNVPKFTWKITVGDKEAYGTANTKKKAKQDAARNMFMQISENISLLQTLQSSIPSTEENFQNHIGNLSMFCSRNDLPQPQYSEDMENGPAHQRSFYWNCIVGRHREVGIARSTKAAKQLAAQAMYLKLVNEVSEPNDADIPDSRLNEKFMPFKIEKSEKLAFRENEDMDFDGNDCTEPISPEPFDNEESEARTFDYRSREDRRVDQRYEENVHYRNTDRPSTSGYSSRKRSHHSEGSSNIRIESEEVLERKYKIKLSSFTDWEIPNASQSTSVDNEIPQTSPHSHDKASRSTATQQNYVDVKREMKYSHSIQNTRLDEESLIHQDADEFNYSPQDQESISHPPAVSNDPEGLEDVDANAEDQFSMRESEIDITEYENLPEVKFKIKLGALITPTSTPTVSNDPIIASPQVSDDRDESISAPAANICENRGDVVDSANLQTDDKIGLRLMNAKSLMESRSPGGGKPDQNQISIMNSSFKTETMNRTEENLLHSQQTPSAKSQMHQDCSNDDSATKAAQPATQVKNFNLEKFIDECGKFYDDSLCRNSNADPRLNNQSPMDLSEDDNMIGDPLEHKTERESKSDVKVESERTKSNKNKIPEISNVNVQPKPELLTGNKEKEDHVYTQNSLARNSNSSVVLREPEESVIEIKQPLKMKISEYYHVTLTENGIDLKPRICNRVCDLIDALSKWDVVKNPHIVEEGLEVLKDILILIDVHLERVVYEAHDKEYIVIIRINTIPEIVETTKNSDLNEANRSVFFKVIHRVNKMLL